MKRIIVIVFLLALLAGCASKNYYSVKHVTSKNRNRYYNGKKDKGKKRVKYVNKKIVRQKGNVKTVKNNNKKQKPTTLEETVQNESDTTGFIP